ncbi:flagellin N-terminal helical domain-containing protein [Rugamonas apoptosis]|uniref:Flagellin n=1 Tax=Rugamonas apoptosis TaxID=2758570 RepID=A0A7W2IMH7_9BURK|nr:flagellin [Rugamonas apoptosis]MBA5689629.1 flagellin [Rugamonas apoptosis]
MQINSNLSALNAQRSYARAETALDTTLQRLSSGQRVNSARDDAAGLAIGARLTAGVRGLQRAAQNVSEGISLLQVADGAMGEILTNYQRIRELAVQAANDTNSVADRGAIQHEADALVQASIGIASSAQYNHLNLLDGSYRTQLQVGDQAGAVIDVAIPAVYRSSPSGSVQADVPEQQVNLSGQVTAALHAGDLTLNGAAVGAAVAGAGAGQGAASAWAAAAAINGAGVLGVTASATTTISADVAGSGNIAAGGLSINGVALGPIAGASASALAASAAAAIAGAGIAGVTASASGGTLTLAAADGSDITIAGGGVLGLTAGVHSGTVTLLDAPGGGAHNLLVGGANPGAVGLTAGPHASTPTGNTVTVLRSAGGGGDPPIDLSSFAGATAALDFIDTKIDSGIALRGQLGALQNRLQLAYDGDVGTGANLAAARSRILDTDYASETAQLTRSRILQQAAASMVAQANATPQQALLLLR